MIQQDVMKKIAINKSKITNVPPSKFYKLLYTFFLFNIPDVTKKLFINGKLTHEPVIDNKA
jgi:hypothetical protein